jgi:hypothetical protein
MRSQFVTANFPAQIRDAKGEVLWETGSVSTHGLIQSLGANSIQGGEIRIEHDLLSPKKEDKLNDVLRLRNNLQTVS